MNAVRRMLLSVVVGLLAVVAVSLLAASWSQRQRAEEQQLHQLSLLMAAVTRGLAPGQQQPEAWLTPLLADHGVLSFTLLQGEQPLYRYQAATAVVTARGGVRQLNLELEQHPQLRVVVSVRQPSWRLPLTPLPTLLVVVALLLAVVALWPASARLRHWVRAVERLEQRARAGLDGDLPLPGRGEEQPQAVVALLDRYRQQLADAHEERLRFDRLIRNNTLLDMQTGFGNRLFFDTRLEAALRDNEPGTGGAVYLIQLRELELLQQQHGEAACSEVIQAFCNLLRNALKGQGDAIIARRSHSDFAVLSPSLALRDVEEGAERLVRMLRRLALPAGMDRDSFVHVGVAIYQQGDEPYQVLAEADMALRAAQLQGPLDYYMYDRNTLDCARTLGSVRWRTLLEIAISKRSFVLFMQTAISAANGQPHHHEVLSRMRDDKGHLLSAGVFLPMACRCGLTPKIDRIILEQLLRLLEQDRHQGELCSVNLAPETLLDAKFMQWLLPRLADHPALAQRLIIEVSEYHLAHQLHQLEPPLRLLKQAGCRLLVDKVGQTVVGTHYIGKLHVDYLKLHPSVVRGVQDRPESQLFIRSLQSSVNVHGVAIFALGVENDAEWQALQTLGVHGGQGHYFSERLEKLAECAGS